MDDFQRIKLILISLGIDEHLICPRCHFFNDIQLDCHTYLLFIEQIEAYFGIDVDLNMYKVETVDQLLAIIMRGIYIRDILLSSEGENYNT